MFVKSLAIFYLLCNAVAAEGMHYLIICTSEKPWLYVKRCIEKRQNVQKLCHSDSFLTKMSTGDLEVIFTPELPVTLGA